LNMDMEDLQVTTIGHPDRDECDALLYDPMPGGSGLLEQLCANFPAAVALARSMAGECPGLCASSCIDCFQTYRNAAYHKHLDRHTLLDRLTDWGEELVFEHDIPARQPSAKPTSEEQPVNEVERKLRRMLEAAGFPDGKWQETMPLPQPLVSTTPDVTYIDSMDEDHQVFIYLDGLSAHIHGNPMTQHRDVQIRNELRSRGHDVIEISVHDLDDRQAMVRHLKRLARLLIGRDAVVGISGKAEQWFGAHVERRQVTPQKIEVIYDGQQLRIVPERAEVSVGQDVIWDCEQVAVAEHKLITQIYFGAKEGGIFGDGPVMITCPPDQAATLPRTAVVPNDAKREFKYGVRLLDANSGDEIDDEDPYLILVG